MTRRRLYTITLLLLLATAPWPFWSDAPSGLVLGLPRWAAYSLLATAVFAWVTHRFLMRYWELSAGDHEDPSDGRDARHDEQPQGQPEQT